MWEATAAMIPGNRRAAAPSARCVGRRTSPCDSPVAIRTCALTSRASRFWKVLASPPARYVVAASSALWTAIDIPSPENEGITAA